jgi:glycosyltransferase involved in cell wall biosynthesis
MGGSGWARLGQYAPMLSDVAAVGVLIHNSQLGIFGVRDWDGNDHFDLDVIVMQRIMFRDIPDKMHRAKAAGQIIVNDIDDWYWGLSPQNHAFAASHPKQNPTENIKHYRKVLSASSYVTTSTQYLADRISKWVRCPIKVLSNTVDLAKFTPLPVRDTTVPTVGWVGSTGHRSGDLAEVRGVLGALFEEGKIKVHHSGTNENHPSFADEIQMHPKLVTTLPLVAPEHYHKLFVFDVGIVPLSNMPFNRAKSAIKGLEYAAAGIPFVASSSDSYRELRDNGIGMVVRRPYQWRAMIESLCDPVRRSEEVAKNNERLPDYDIAHGAARLKEFFGSIV